MSSQSSRSSSSCEKIARRKNRPSDAAYDNKSNDLNKAYDKKAPLVNLCNSNKTYGNRIPDLSKGYNNKVSYENLCNSNKAYGKRIPDMNKVYNNKSPYDKACDSNRAYDSRANSKECPKPVFNSRSGCFEIDSISSSRGETDFETPSSATLNLPCFKPGIGPQSDLSCCKPNEPLSGCPRSVSMVGLCDESGLTLKSDSSQAIVERVDSECGKSSSQLGMTLPMMREPKSQAVKNFDLHRVSSCLDLQGRSSGDVQVDVSSSRITQKYAGDSANQNGYLVKSQSINATGKLRASSSSSSFSCLNQGCGDSTLASSLGFYDEDWNGDYEVLYNWIDRMEFTKTKKNINKDFSDGVLMAELLKKLWPKLVDLHNYSPANSFSNKMTNWNTLNTKVLRRLTLSQPQKTLQDLAKAEPGVLETLLSKVKSKYERSKLMPPPHNGSCEDHSSIILNGQKLNRDQMTVMIDRCRKLEDELTEADEIIKVLGNKVAYLEKLLADKDNSIAHLKCQLCNCRCQLQRATCGNMDATTSDIEFRGLTDSNDENFVVIQNSPEKEI